MIEFYVLYNGRTVITELAQESEDILDAERYFDKAIACDRLNLLEKFKEFIGYEVVKVKMNIEKEK